MKKALRRSISSVALVVAALIAHGAQVVYTPSYIDGSTNTMVLAGTNATVSTLLGASTNYYNLPNVAFNTNYWPAIPVPPLLSVGPPWVNMGVQFLAQTNTGDKITVRLAASVDSTHWVSNQFSFTTGPSASFPSLLTNNAALGFPYWALQAIENPSASNVVGVVLQFAPKAN